MKQSLAWRIGPEGKPTRLNPGLIDLEKKLEQWLIADIDIVASDILVMKSQAVTTWGTKLDLLAIDAEGNLVIVELKRDQTLRDTVAQAIEYAAWASQLSYEEVVDLAAKHFGTVDAFEEAFEKRFGVELPASLNQVQRILVVAPTIDDTTETVVNFLANTFHMPINAVGFDVFGDPADLTIVRHFVREPSDVPTPTTAKKKQTRSLEQIRELAAQNGVAGIVDEFLSLKDLFPQIVPYYLTFNMRAKAPDKRSLSALSVYPTAETRAGAVELYVGQANLRDLCGISETSIERFASELATIAKKLDYNWEGWTRLQVGTVEEARAISKCVRTLVTEASAPATVV